MAFTKADWEQMLTDLQKLQTEEIKPSQEDIDYFNKMTAMSGEEAHDITRMLISALAESGFITADVETEMLFCVGEKYNPQNGGWADGIQPFQKYAIIRMLRAVLLPFDVVEVSILDVIELSMN
jgi:hypothetical protein